MPKFQKIDHVVARISVFLAVLGGVGLVFAISITCLSIILKLMRRALDRFLGDVFNSDIWAWVRPILGEEELVQYGVGFALFAALPWAMYAKGHVKIDLFEKRFSAPMNKLLDLIGDLMFAAIAYLILTQQWFQIFRKARRKEEPMSDLLFSSDPLSALSRLRVADESQILGIKIWPLYTVAEIFVFVFLIVAMFCVVRSGRRVLGVDP